MKEKPKVKHQKSKSIWYAFITNALHEKLLYVYPYTSTLNTHSLSWCLCKLLMAFMA